MSIYVLDVAAPACPGCQEPLDTVSYALVIDGDVVRRGTLQWAPAMAGYIAPPSLTRWAMPDSGGTLAISCERCQGSVHLVPGPGFFDPDVPHMLVFSP